MARKIWSKEEEEFLRQNLGKMTYDELSEYFNLPKQKIIHKVHKLGLNRREASGELWSQKEDDILKQHFEYAPKNMLLELLPNRSWSAITQRGRNVLGLNRLTQDKYKIDYNFFSTWNPESAYIFGFIASDGYLKYEYGPRKETSLQFEISEQDADILFKIKDALKYEGPVTHSTRKTVKLSIANKKICKDLLDKGIPTNNKTFTMKWPETLPDELANHFIRGLFDGDGSVYYNRTICYQFLGTKNILEEIYKRLPYEAVKNCKIHYRKEYGNSADVYVLQINNKKAGLIFDYLYDNATIYLERKYRKAIELLKVIEIVNQL